MQKTRLILLKRTIQILYRLACFSKFFKIAQITPIHKKSSLRNISNYRPVSVLNNLSKIFENLLYKRLHFFFVHASNFLAKSQFGFWGAS